MKSVIALLIACANQVFASDLYRLADIPLAQGGGVCRKYLILEPDSTYVLAGIYESIFGNMGISMSADSGVWTIQADSIALASVKCISTFGTCDTDRPLKRFAFRDGIISDDQGLVLMDYQTNTEVVKRVKSSGASVESTLHQGVNAPLYFGLSYLPGCLLGLLLVLAFR